MTTPDVNLRTGMLNSVNSLMAKLEAEEYEKVYYVDNINGSDTLNNGLSKTKPFAQLAQAITTWEAYRAAQTNVYVRGLIKVRGTGTAYTALAALPNYCDIAGYGASPRGNGAGIAIIGANGADGIAGTARGLGLYNLQIRSGGSFWCMDFVNLFRSTIQHCAIHANVAAPDGGIRFSGASGGLEIIDCHWKGDGDVICKVGIRAQGTHLNESLIQDCIIGGTTAGVLIDNTVKNGDQTVFRRNHIGDTGKGCVTAIDDNQPADLVGYIQYCDNSVMGTNLITIANSGAARCHGNRSANAFVAVTAS